MSSNEISILLTNLCREMEHLWRVTEYNTFFYDEKKARAITIAEPGTPVLPITQKPIRGTQGVEVNIYDHNDKDAKALTYRLILDSLLKIPHWRTENLRSEEVEAREKIWICADALYDGFDKIPNLNERIAESSGFKHYDPQDLSETINRPESDFKVEKALFTSNILSSELSYEGFDPSKKAPFNKWGDIISRATEKILAIARKSYNDYEVVVVLNAPMIDEASDISLSQVFFQDKSFDLTIGPVTDDLLSRLYTSDKNAQLRRINTAIKFQISIDVQDSIEAYLNIYWIGAQIAERVVDCLRLLRDEDIGVIALEVFYLDDYTPRIRKTYEVFYKAELAPFVPKRFSFETELTAPLSQEELAQLQRLLSAYDEINSTKGLNVAIRRFRSSCERYHPSDPERLLDIAFSFEAIFLNDGDNKELSYRLSLRVARFLGESLEERQEMFETVKNLYTFRSKIAHGETLDTMRPSDAEKLRKVLDHAPRVLKDALISMIVGNGPKGLFKNEDIGSWWRRLELS